MSSWIQLEKDKVDRPKKEKKNGIKFEVSLSPYDIPEAYRGKYCKNRNLFIIEFRYLSKEDTVEKKISDKFSILEGKNSGRLYAILVDVDNHGIEEVSLELIIDSVKESISASNKKNKSQNRNRLLLDAYEDDLVSSLSDRFQQGSGGNVASRRATL